MSDNNTKRIDIDKALREIITRSGSAAEHPLARPEEQTAAKTIALLALVVAEQEKRIKDLEARLSGRQP